MNSKITNIAKNVAYKNKNNLKFDISLDKKQLTNNHNYWLYFIKAYSKGLGYQNFTIFVTKQAFPTEASADQLASTLGVAKAKSLLDEVDSEKGRPLTIPLLWEGWGIL